MKTVKTYFGHKLSTGEISAYKKIKKLIEKEERFTKQHGMADALRSYFIEEE